MISLLRMQRGGEAKGVMQQIINNGYAAVHPSEASILNLNDLHCSFRRTVLGYKLKRPQVLLHYASTWFHSVPFI